LARDLAAQGSVGIEPVPHLDIEVDGYLVGVDSGAILRATAVPFFALLTYPWSFWQDYYSAFIRRDAH